MQRIVAYRDQYRIMKFLPVACTDGIASMLYKFSYDLKVFSSIISEVNRIDDGGKNSFGLRVCKISKINWVVRDENVFFVFKQKLLCQFVIRVL